MEDLINKNQVDFGKTTMHKASGSVTDPIPSDRNLPATPQ